MVQPLPMGRPVIELVGVSGKSLKEVSFTASGITCVIGEWDEDKEELSRFLTLEEKPREGELRFNVRNPKKYIRLIPRDRLDAELKVRDLLKLYERKFGRGNEVWAEVMGIDKEKRVKDLSEIGKFKLELLQLFYGETKFVIAEDFVDVIEEQFRTKAVKDLVKAVNLLKATLVMFTGTFRFHEVCDSRVVIYGGRVMEIAWGERVYHPYSEVLSRARLEIGNRLEKINVVQVGEPADFGCPFHPYCWHRDRELRRMCVSSVPPLFNFDGNLVRCWKFVQG